ncbi:MAG TPA: Mut7-C RNAse domain-containing protein [Candidatus Bathyarchaeia archaeon]|nr:Mut7-C RNAse domain-containing protein [Candidatus Bathyarchaeia archaeon]
MRFLVDGMLGGLARWLRILGHDVRYGTTAIDNDLLKIAREENMILLTRDKELYQRAIAKEIVSLLVLGETEEERLAQMRKTFGISLDPITANTKCPECGTNLVEASKSDVADRVPQASLKLYDQFWKCASQNCRKVYWIGSHWKQIRQTLGEAEKLSELEQ